jgi:hypothetical protein
MRGSRARFLITIITRTDFHRKFLIGLPLIGVGYCNMMVRSYRSFNGNVVGSVRDGYCIQIIVMHIIAQLGPLFYPDSPSF